MSLTDMHTAVKGRARGNRRMTGAEITAIILAGALALAGIYDVAVLVAWGNSATVSAVVADYASRFPIIPFAVGILCGHLFWRRG